MGNAERAEPEPPEPAAEMSRSAVAGSKELGGRIRGPGVVGFILWSAVVAGVDFALAIHPWLSPALTLLQVLIVPFWTATARRIDRDAALPGRTVRYGERIKLVFLHLVWLGMLVACLVAKVLVLIASRTSDSAHLTPSYWTYTVTAFALVSLGLVMRPRVLARLLAAAADHHARLMTISFGITALLGGFLLTMPVSLNRIEDASFLNGLFHAVSAVCVTGLAVTNVTETYSWFGQLVLLALIQVGGMGIMVLSAFFSVIARRKLQVRSAAVMAAMIDAESITGFRRQVASIVLFTFAIEAAGAALLYSQFISYPEVATHYQPDLGLSGSGSHLWAAIFHAVSAFCNAGFSTFHDNLVPFVGSWPTNLTIMALIVLGGLGFPVLDELLRAMVGRLCGRRPPALSLHARVVLTVTGLMIAVGAFGYFGLECNRSMHDLPWHARLLAAIFQSVTTRTAGFNTIDFAAMGPPALLFTCVLMFAGGSPGSTAGGIKTTTLSVLFATLRAELGTDQRPHLFRRMLPLGIVRKATSTAFLSLLILTVTYFLLLLSEEQDPLRLLFEATSAFGTAGLSAGITPNLTAFGRIVILATMFVGRIGPLTFALSIAENDKPSRYRLPEEKVAIG